MTDVDRIPALADLEPPGDEQDFDVSWEITVTAATSQEAARKAANILCKAHPHQQVFDVRPAPDDGYAWERVDLAADRV